MNLPYYERKALVTAMALHEKGRAALKKEDYPLALVIFLEADKEFRYITVFLLPSYFVVVWSINYSDLATLLVLYFID